MQVSEQNAGTTYPYVLEDVSLDFLHQERQFQFREKLLWWQVEKYAAAIEAEDEETLNRPLNAVVGKEGKLLLIDGHHFLQAYKLAKNKHGRQLFDRVRFVKVHGDATVMSVDEIRYRAIELNDRNGLPNLPSAQKEKIRLALKLGKHLTEKGKFKSFWTIAKEQKLPRTSVWRWIKDLDLELHRQIAAHSAADWQKPDRHKGGFRAMKKEIKEGMDGFRRMCEAHRTMAIMGAPEKELAKQREQIEWCCNQLLSMKRDLDQRLTNEKSEDF